MAEQATGTPDGIDRAGVEAWFAENVPGAEPPLDFERIAGGHSNLTYRVTDAGGRRWALRRPPLGKRLGSAHDMGREHKVVSALAADRGAGRAGRRPLRGRERQRRALLRDGVRRGADPARRWPRPRPSPTRPTAGRSASASSTRWPTIHAVDPDAVGPRRPRPQGGLRRPPAAPLAGPVGEVEDARAAARSTRSTSASRRRIPEQGPATIVHGDYRLDNMILTPERRGRRGGRLGALHARRPARRRRPADGLLARAGEEADRRCGQPANLAPGFPTRDGAAPPATPSAPAATSPSSTSSSPSATGSWRSSSRASTPATPPAATARSTRASRTSPAWSSASPRPSSASAPANWPIFSRAACRVRWRDRQAARRSHRRF